MTSWRGGAFTHRDCDPFWRDIKPPTSLPAAVPSFRARPWSPPPGSVLAARAVSNADRHAASFAGATRGPVRHKRGEGQRRDEGLGAALAATRFDRDPTSARSSAGLCGVRQRSLLYGRSATRPRKRRFRSPRPNRDVLCQGGPVSSYWGSCGQQGATAVRVALGPERGPRVFSAVSSRRRRLRMRRTSGGGARHNLGGRLRSKALVASQGRRRG